ncbi:MerR family transcriptional regulator [Tsukamurella sp. 8F]|uniref:MerR family transcriptional regulator n=1 Tax=unclassified Tsukamurella TaxID=2633480 RepID=UPI0023B9F660|nr:MULTISPECIES: MerR family transcriptional regulator [unclassified Tsukamurella]MDF0530415.1 MerR family transcriptional regulator [Tsukamurella sp. 8J]MDF0587764.1 MerR family transcriptional regulator [Tsukamurella sp. 8F]
MSDGHPIGAVAERVGLDSDTLRDYERRGILPCPARDGTGRRRYTDSDIHLIEVLLHLKETGMPLADIADFTRYAAADPDGVPERLRILREHRLRIRAKRRELDDALVLVDRKISDYMRRPPAAP